MHTVKIDEYIVFGSWHIFLALLAGLLDPSIFRERVIPVFALAPQIVARGSLKWRKGLAKIISHNE